MAKSKEPATDGADEVVVPKEKVAKKKTKKAAKKTTKKKVAKKKVARSGSSATAPTAPGPSTRSKKKVAKKVARSGSSATASPRSTRSEKKVAKKTAKKKSKKAAKKSAKKSAKSSKGDSVDKITMGQATKLVIVESPAKCKTINKYLGRSFKVVASKGHIRDLPKNRFGIDIENDFDPHYVIINKKKKYATQLRRAAKAAKLVYLCPDPDREGEAIAWHLVEALKIPPEKIRRVTFTEITQKAVQEAFKTPGEINMSLVEAQQARRILDRVVGYKLSPLLWKKVIKRLSAGRVQSAAARLVCQREDEIDAFVAEEFWRITAKLKAPGPKRKMTFSSELRGMRRLRKDEESCPICGGAMHEMNTPRGKMLRCDAAPECVGGIQILHDGYMLNDLTISNATEAEALKAAIADKEFLVSKIVKRETKSRPSAPFITSTLQQAAATRLRFTTRKTMMVAQKLYEGIALGPLGSAGLITYMRTDSVKISDDAIDQSRKFIESRYGMEYLPEKPNIYKSGGSAQEAHEAIRPTTVANTPETVERYLEPDQLKLYRLIWERFVACQMTPARYDDTSATIYAGDYVFPAHGRVQTFPGSLAVYGATPSKDKKASKELPPLAEEQVLERHSVGPTQHFTQPPSRYSEGGLVKALQKEGIARPSTYATIISTIQLRGYVKKIGSSFHATELGRIVNRKLLDFFPTVIDLKFTAEMESLLDKVGEGEQDWVKLLKDFYLPFSENLTRAEEEMPEEEEKLAPGGEKCEFCGRPMVVKLSRSGRFVGCGGFPDCRYSLPLGADGQVVQVPDGARGARCPNCDLPMSFRTTRRGRFMACTGFPTCRTAIPLDEEGNLIHLEKTDEVCEKCGSPMSVRMGSYGKFLACTGYPKCRNARPMPGSLPGEEISGLDACDACGAQMVLRRTKKGGYLLCSKHPECKTRRKLNDLDREKVAATGNPLPGDEELVPVAKQEEPPSTPAS